ncbi:sn1-specific diacylglycerol lipase beta [Caerostris darwini]|uniref:Sn1-specific diacylglycerol lipase beta n=1 Tax=Caerostris darwini TaxID=1538125 RepID=A0AAV4MI80_9ARAC|nr:sn1-specific diacylglycerol lipase beta [Caerostris darwini]
MSDVVAGLLVYRQRCFNIYEFEEIALAQAPSTASEDGVSLEQFPPLSFPPWMNLQLANKYFNLGLGVLGWPWVLYRNFTCGCCLRLKKIRGIVLCRCESVHFFPVNFFVTYDHETKAILVMARGTMSMDDVLTDVAATFATMDNPGCPPGILCHQGVLNASREIKRLSIPDNEKEIFDVMKYEVYRYNSFMGRWPLSYVKPKDLATDGFFYLLSEDRVQCAFCSIIIDDWNTSSTHSLVQSEMIRHACDIFLSSLVQKVVMHHLNITGGHFISFHHLCEAISDYKDREPAKSNCEVLSSENSAADENVNDLKDICKICMSEEMNIVFEPCHHLVSCQNCAQIFFNCPLCRKCITNKMKVFWG